MHYQEHKKKKKKKILTFNQTAADQKEKHFPTILIFEIELKLVAYLNFVLPVRWFVHDEVRAVSSAQIAILHRTSSGRK